MKLICKDECTIAKPSLKGKGWELFTGVLVLFVPKCAFCWAAYMSVLSSWGIVISYQRWFLPVSLVLFLFTLTKLLIVAIRRKNFIAFGLAVLAGLLILSQRSVPGMDVKKLLAIALMILAVMMDNFLVLYRQLQLYFRKQPMDISHQ
ncbi:MAG: hypothetical protein ABIQ31_09715 [Ferruginibacter sp.]